MIQEKLFERLREDTKFFCTYLEALYKICSDSGISFSKEELENSIKALIARKYLRGTNL